MKKLLWSILFICIYMVNYGQQLPCSCTYEEYDHMDCSPSIFDNHGKLFWSYNCDSAWLTFQTPKQANIILFSTDMIGYIGKLGIVA